jgi:DNA-binding transcriptional LysR family regulator
MLQGVVDDLMDVREGGRGLVQIQAHTTAVSGNLPKLLARFVAENPKIDITLDERSSTEIIAAVTHGVCDLGLVSGTVDPGELEVIPWKMDKLVAVLPAGNPLVGRTSVRLEEMLVYPFISMRNDSALLGLFRAQAHALGRHLIERAHVTAFDVAAKIVAEGLGVSILPAEIAGALVDQYGAAIRDLDEPWAKRQLIMCVRELSKRPGATRAIVSFLQKHGSIATT